MSTSTSGSSPTRFRHIVLFRWNAEATDEAKQAVAEGLASLPARIPQIRRYDFGPDLDLETGNYHFALVAEFDDADAYRAYMAHPDHRQVVRERILPILAGRAAVQLDL